MSDVEIVTSSLYKSGDESNVKLFDQNSVDYYCSLFGFFLPSPPVSIYVLIWVWLIRSFYMAYAISVTVFIFAEFVTTKRLSWVLFNLILSVKCICIAYIIIRLNENIDTIRGSAQYHSLARQAYEMSLLYFRPVVLLQLIVYIVWVIIRYGAFPLGYWVLFAMYLVFGTYGFACGVGTVTFMCITETLHLQEKLLELGALAERQTLCKSDFLDAVKVLESKKKGVYRMNDLMLGSALLNTAVLIVLLFTYRSITADRTYFFSVWYVVYVITMLFLSDISYLFVVLPLMSRCNDMMRALSARVASDTWDTSVEAKRIDVLMAMVAVPLQVTFVGIEMTKAEMMRRLIGLAVGVLSVMAKYMQMELQ